MNVKDVLNEIDTVYIVLELAPEGELFNLIIDKGKHTEDEARKVLVQILSALEYLVTTHLLTKKSIY
jgi:serine/threonine-protein kinase Chk2